MVRTAKNKKPDNSKAVMDVAHPGKSAPSPNSKSVIVSNRPIISDPIIKEDDMGKSPKLSHSAAVKLKKLVPAEPVSPTEVVEADKSDSHPRPVAEQKLPAKQPEADEPTQDEPADVKTDDDTAEENDPQKAVQLKEAEAELVEQQKRAEAVAKLVESKEYFLPINSVEKRRTKHFVFLGVGLSIILAVAWLDVALDAGLIQLSSIKPVTHFFSS